MRGGRLLGGKKLVPGSRFPVAAAAVLAALTLAAYGNSFDALLLFDSHARIALDPRIQSWNPDTVAMIFTRDYWWPEQTSNLYRPLTTLTYWANYTLLGGELDVAGYHVANLLIHFANACLVLTIARKLGRREGIALLSAALFAVHPIATEAVTNVVGRADLLATLAVLLGAWCYIRSADAAGRARVLWLAGAGASAFLGVFAKESAIVLLVFVALYDWLFRRARAPLAHYAVFVPAIVAVLVIRAVIAYRAPLLAEYFVSNPIAGAPWLNGFMTAWKVIARYLAMLFVPVHLSADYSYNQIPMYGATAGLWQNVQSWIGLLVTTAATLIAVRIRKTQPLTALGILFFMLALLPTSNLLFPIGSIMAERFLYLPSVGFAMVAAWGLFWIASRVTVQPRVVTALVALPVLACGARTYVRNNDWRDERGFWERTVARSPNSFNAHRGLAATIASRVPTERGLDSAMTESERARAILDSPPLPIAQRDNSVLMQLGEFYRLKGQRLRARGVADSAAAMFRKSLEALEAARAVDVWRGGALRTRKLDRGWKDDDIAGIGDYTLYLQLGDTYLELQDWANAITAAQRAQVLMPDAAQAYVLEGVATFYSGKPEAAIVPIVSGMLIDPRRPDIWENLMTCYRAARKTPPVVSLGTGFRFDMNNPEAQALVRDAARAVEARFIGAKRRSDGAAFIARVHAAHPH